MNHCACVETILSNVWLLVCDAVFGFVCFRRATATLRTLFFQIQKEIPEAGKGSSKTWPGEWLRQVRVVVPQNSLARWLLRPLVQRSSHSNASGKGIFLFWSGVDRELSNSSEGVLCGLEWHADSKPQRLWFPVGLEGMFVSLDVCFCG